jgi:hypothetical protein
LAAHSRGKNDTHLRANWIGKHAGRIPRIKGDVEQLVNEKLGKWFDKHSTVARRIIGKRIEAARTREARELTRRKSARAARQARRCPEKSCSLPPTAGR